MYIHLNLGTQMINNKLYYLCYIEIIETICVKKKRAQAHLKMLSTKPVYKSFI